MLLQIRRVPGASLWLQLRLTSPPPTWMETFRHFPCLCILSLHVATSPRSCRHAPLNRERRYHRRCGPAVAAGSVFPSHHNNLFGRPIRRSVSQLWDECVSSCQGGMKVVIYDICLFILYWLHLKVKIMYIIQGRANPFEHKSIRETCLMYVCSNMYVATVLHRFNMLLAELVWLF